MTVHAIYAAYIGFGGVLGFMLGILTEKASQARYRKERAKYLRELRR